MFRHSWTGVEAQAMVEDPESCADASLKQRRHLHDHEQGVAGTWEHLWRCQ